jgi:uncharacterized repeat protein (TIGR03803 family)
MFFLPPTKSFKVLHAFQGTDGSAPAAPLLGTGTGNLYGTTFYGGAFRVGTVFVRSVSGVYTVVHSFAGPDGSAPAAGLIADASGNFYGTTSGGGASGFGGTIFKIAPGGTLTTLHSFCSMTGCPGGYNPVAGLFLEKGNLYGTTFNGGGSLSLGVVFKIRTDGSNYTVLHTFMGGTSDGGESDARLSADASGNLYGTTHSGGANGRGTVFIYHLSRRASSMLRHSMRSHSGIRIS